MTEPDFDQIAQRMADALYVTDADGGTGPRTDGETVIMTREWYVDQLRQVWNASNARTPETPDFGQMARSTTGFIRVDPESREALELNIIDLLSRVWNARGAADVVAIDAELSARMGEIGYSVSTFDTAIKDALTKLDR